MSRSEDQAKAQYESICEMVVALNVDYDRLGHLKEERRGLQDAQAALSTWDAENAEELSELHRAATGCENQDAARDNIQADPLSVQVRSGWYDAAPGWDERAPEEFEILLCTGGPAVRITGELDDHCQPSSARMEHQDWGTCWTQDFGPDQDVLLQYCSEFYFGG